MITDNSPKRKLNLHEMIDAIDSISGKGSKQKKIELIQKFSREYPCFTDYLRGLYDDRIEFALPEGRPPYTPAGGAAPSSWHKAHMSLGDFVKGIRAEHYDDLKREMRWIHLLESIDEKDSFLISDMTDKRTSSTGLTKKLVEEAVPNLVS
jgi:hypothetical protein